MFYTSDCDCEIGVGADGKYHCMKCMKLFSSMKAMIHTEFHYGALEWMDRWKKLAARKVMVIRNRRKKRPPFYGLPKKV